jgi:endoglycosylceramidase
MTSAIVTAVAQRRALFDREAVTLGTVSAIGVDRSTALHRPPLRASGAGALKVQESMGGKRVAVALLAWLAGLGATAGEVQARGVVPAFSFLHVGAPGGPARLPQVLDRAGRSVLLRGVNVNGLEDYYQANSTPLALDYPVPPSAYRRGRCPRRDTAVESMAVCAFDAGQLRTFGYDAVRLAVSWSLLEPKPGRINTTYIDRVAQVVGWLQRAGIYSVIDLHQDAWSKYVFTPPGESCPPPLSPVSGAHEADGAPQWASRYLSPACYFQAREVDPAVQEDFQRFWSDTAGPDGVGLQEHYAAAELALARRFHGDRAVAGYDIMNEPSPGLTPPPEMDASEVYPFYAKVVKTVVDGVRGFRQLFFIEPDVTRDVTDQRYAQAPWSTYSAYRSVVYAPHIYTHVFTPDGLANDPGAAPLYPVSAGYASAAADARTLRTALWDGEFGDDVDDDNTTLRQHYEQQDALGAGGALWVWKADGDAKTGFSVLHGPFGRGTPFPSRVKFTARAYPLYTSGTLTRLAYNPDTATFDVRGVSPRRLSRSRAGHATVVWIPPASSGRVRAVGARLRVVALGGGAREAYVYPNRAGYRVYDDAPIRVCRATLPLGPHAVAARAYRGRRQVGRYRRRRHALVVRIPAARGRVRIRIVERVRTGGRERRVVRRRRVRCAA